MIGHRRFHRSQGEAGGRVTSRAKGHRRLDDHLDALGSVVPGRPDGQRSRLDGLEVFAPGVGPAGVGLPGHLRVKLPQAGLGALAHVRGCRDPGGHDGLVA